MSADPSRAPAPYQQRRVHLHETSAGSSGSIAAPVYLETALQRDVGARASVPKATVVHHFDQLQDIEAARAEAESAKTSHRVEGQLAELAGPISTAHPDVQLAERPELVVATQLDDDDMLVTQWALLTLCLGWLGAHQFALGRVKWGVVYILTMGFCGWGIVVDLVRIPGLLRSRAEHVRMDGHNNYFVERSNMAQRAHDCYVLWIFGFLGLHQFYLGRTRIGILYLCTFGLCGMYVFDIVRIPMIVKRDPQEFQLVEAYMALIPGGFFGLHHFYLGNNARGLLYLFTLGLFGIGVLLDLLRMPSLVERANEARGRRSGTMPLVQT